MKYFPIAIIFLLFSCHSAEQQRIKAIQDSFRVKPANVYIIDGELFMKHSIMFPWSGNPKAVHNFNTGKWAVRLDRNDLDSSLFLGPWFGLESMDHLENDGKSYYDTTNIAVIGREFTFTDSLTAITSYKNWIHRIDMCDQAYKRYKHKKDSIFKHDHTYQ